MQRFVESEQDKRMLIRFLETEKMPYTVSVSKGGKRSLAQNRLQRLWLNEISDQRGDIKPEEVRGYCKLAIGVPLLRAENEEFREKYDAIVKPLPYEQKLALMMEPLDFPVTRLMTTKQHASYLDGIQNHFAEQGNVLTDPATLGLSFREEPQSATPPADGDSAAPQAPHGAVANPIPGDEPGQTEAGEQSSGVKAADGQQSSPASRHLTDEERTWLISAAKQLVAVTKPGWDPNEVRKSYSAILKEMTPKGITDAAVAKLNSVGKHCAAICDGSEDFDLDLLAGIALCEPADLRSA